MLARIMLFVVALSFSQLMAEDKYVTAKSDSVEVYETTSSKVPMWGLTRQDRLRVVEVAGSFYKIEIEGKMGYVKKSDVVSLKQSKSFVFDNAEIMGYLDNPTPVYIIDADDANSDPINLERSFKDALRENVDRETIQRQVEK